MLEVVDRRRVDLSEQMAILGTRVTFASGQALSSGVYWGPDSVRRYAMTGNEAAGSAGRGPRVVAGILGGIGAFVGLFVMFGDKDQYVGFGGDLSWRVGNIEPIVGYGLLIGGVALVVVALALLLVAARQPTVVARSSPLRDLLVHATVFAISRVHLARDWHGRCRLRLSGDDPMGHRAGIPPSPTRRRSRQPTAGASLTRSSCERAR
jgi:hypothetical protein